MYGIIEIMRKAFSLLEEGKSITVVTVVETSSNTPAEAGKKMIVPSEGRPIGTVGGGSLEREAQNYCSTREKTPVEIREYDLASIGMTCGGRVTLMFEYFRGKSYFVLFGGGHVGSALAPILEGLGYTPVVVDNREGIIENHKAAGRPALLCSYDDISCADEYLANGMCFIASHNHRFDTGILKQVLKRDTVEFSYIGMIGSGNKVRQAFDEVKKDGLSIPDCVFAPVGIDLGGGTPAEIAVSIASEILAVSYGKSVPHMRR